MCLSDQWGSLQRRRRQEEDGFLWLELAGESLDQDLYNLPPALPDREKVISDFYGLLVTRQVATVTTSIIEVVFTTKKSIYSFSSDKTSSGSRFHSCMKHCRH
jgi:hypothetical protein